MSTHPHQLDRRPARASTQPYDEISSSGDLHERDAPSGRTARRCVDHAREQPASASIHDVVAEQHRERVVADVLAGDGHRVAEPERARPGGRSGCRPSRPGPGPRSSSSVLALLLQVVLELEVAVEVVLDARACRGPVMMRMSSMPARTASSTTYWMAGLSTTGSISLGCALVAGRKRVPSPAAGMTALVTDGFMLSTLRRPCWPWAETCVGIARRAVGRMRCQVVADGRTGTIDHRADMLALALVEC